MLRKFRLQLSLLTLFIAAAAMPTHAQSASIQGTVLIDGAEKPIANAEIVLPNLKLSTRSDSAGNFLIAGLPAGKHAIIVRTAGYEAFSAEITFGATQKVEADFFLRAVATKLKTVDVTDKAAGPYALKLREFEERRHAGIGNFITADVFEKEDGRPPSSFLRAHIAGLNIIQVGGRHWLASGRASGNCGTVFMPCKTKGLTMEKIPVACYTKVIVDGRIEFDGDLTHQELFDIDKLNSKDIIGMEYYTGATMPAQFNGTSKENGTCGAVIIWTKNG